MSIQAGKEFQLTARFADKFGQPADPSSQEIIITQPDGQPFLKGTTPERLELGVFRLAIAFPEDAAEGKWSIRWTATIEGRPATEITNLLITHQPVESPRALQIAITPQDFVVTFLGEVSAQ